MDPLRFAKVVCRARHAVRYRKDATEQARRIKGKAADLKAAATKAKGESKDAGLKSPALRSNLGSEARQERFLAAPVCRQAGPPRRAFLEVYESMRKHRTHMRTGTYVLAVGRVAEATLVRGLFP